MDNTINSTTFQSLNNNNNIIEKNETLSQEGESNPNPNTTLRPRSNSNPFTIAKNFFKKKLGNTPEKADGPLKGSRKYEIFRGTPLGMGSSSNLAQFVTSAQSSATKKTPVTSGSVDGLKKSKLLQGEWTSEFKELALLMNQQIGKENAFPGCVLFVKDNVRKTEKNEPTTTWAVALAPTSFQDAFFKNTESRFILSYLQTGREEKGEKLMTNNSYNIKRREAVEKLIHHNLAPISAENMKKCFFISEQAMCNGIIEVQLATKHQIDERKINFHFNNQFSSGAPDVFLETLQSKFEITQEVSEEKKQE